MAHRSMVRRSSAPVVRSPLLMFFRRRTFGHRNQIAQPRAIWKLESDCYCTHLALSTPASRDLPVDRRDRWRVHCGLSAGQNSRSPPLRRSGRRYVLKSPSLRVCAIWVIAA